MVEIVRVKKVSDEAIDAINELMFQLTEEKVLFTKDYLNSVIIKDHIHFFLVKEGGVILGTFTLFLIQLVSGKKVLVEDVVLDSKARGKKIGEKMISFAIDYSVNELGAKKIDLTSNPARIAANALYLKMGFKRRETNVYRWENI